MKVVFIAEAGVNHNGSLKIAKKLINAAKKANADYVKFQSFDYSKLATKNAKKANYQKIGSRKNESQQEMLKKLQLSYSTQKKIIAYCKKKKIKFLSTAFDKENLDFLLKNKLDYIKIPSGEITNYPFLKYISKQKKKILLSTGASTFKEVELARKVLKNKNLLTILQCTSSYPTPIKELNLKTIETFKKKFNCDVGLSDHSLSINSPLAAVALGAKVIEKHFTLDRKMKGPDHKSSLEPDELKQLVNNIRELELALGSKIKLVTKSEKINRKIIRRSIVASKKINKGEKFTLNNLTFKRPAYGLSPFEIKKVLGKISKKNFKTDDVIKL